jgi:hypothetical protein
MPFVTIADTGNNRIVAPSTWCDGAYFVWGEAGAGPGQFNAPRFAAGNMSDGVEHYVWVADTGNHRIQMFRMPFISVEAESWGSIKGRYR